VLLRLAVVEVSRQVKTVGEQLNITDIFDRGVRKFFLNSDAVSISKPALTHDGR
jgi:hypothetical protein